MPIPLFWAIEAEIGFRKPSRGLSSKMGFGAGLGCFGVAGFELLGYLPIFVT